MRCSIRASCFSDAYSSNGGNATDAALVARFSAKTGGVIGAKMLKDPRVLAEITRRRGELCANLEISAEGILKERARLAFYDPRKLFDSDGKPIPIHLLDDDTAAALAGVGRITFSLIARTLTIPEGRRNSSTTARNG